MARGRTAQSEEAGGSFTAVPVSPGVVVGPQMKQFWKAQDKILSEAEAFTRHWFARRHEATKAALSACERATAAHPADAAEAVEVFREWQTRSVERVAEDLREWMDLWVRCAGHLVRGEVGASTDTLDELRKQSAEVRAQHATPV